MFSDSVKDYAQWIINLWIYHNKKFWSWFKIGYFCKPHLKAKFCKILPISYFWVADVFWNVCTRQMQWVLQANEILRDILYHNSPCFSLQWRHNGRNGIANHQRLDCLLYRLFRRRPKKTSKLRVTGLVRGIHRWPVDSPHRRPVTRKMFPFDDVITPAVFKLTCCEVVPCTPSTCQKARIQWYNSESANYMYTFYLYFLTFDST